MSSKNSNGPFFDKNREYCYIQHRGPIVSCLRRGLKILQNAIGKDEWYLEDIKQGDYIYQLADICIGHENAGLELDESLKRAKKSC